MSSDDAAKLQTLLAKQEIFENMMRYCRGVDRTDPELIASTLHPDAEIDTGVHQLSGPSIGEKLAEATRKASVSSSHFVGNVLIEIDGEDVAFCEAYINSLLVIEREGRQFIRVRGSRYLDRAERRDGVWKVAQRRVVDDWARMDEVTGPAPRAGSVTGRRDREDLVYQFARAN